MTRRFLAVSGNLRAVSSNTTLLQAAARLAPPKVIVTLYDGLARLPHFNPDDDATPDAEVIAWRSAVRAADALLISTPEYAHGLPGSLKNALDWLVSEIDFTGKPVALLGASPQSVHAPAQLREILTTMDAQIIDAACITLNLRGSRRDAAELAADPPTADPIHAALDALYAHVAPDR